jgi:hypothetical protein
VRIGCYWAVLFGNSHLHQAENRQDRLLIVVQAVVEVEEDSYHLQLPQNHQDRYLVG